MGGKGRGGEGRGGKGWGNKEDTPPIRPVADLGLHIQKYSFFPLSQTWRKGTAGKNIIFPRGKHQRAAPVVAAAPRK